MVSRGRAEGQAQGVTQEFAVGTLPVQPGRQAGRQAGLQPLTVHHCSALLHHAYNVLHRSMASWLVLKNDTVNSLRSES